jgi:hypothetical protein
VPRLVAATFLVAVLVVLMAFVTFFLIGMIRILQLDYEFEMCLHRATVGTGPLSVRGE